MHRRGEDVAALDADVVVGPLPVNAGRSGSSWIAVPPSKGTSPSRISRIVTVAIATAQAPELPGEVGDQRVEHPDDDALPHRRCLAGDLGAGVDVAAAVGELEGDVGVRVALAAGLLDLTRITARCAASSFSAISTVPVNFIDIAPIL